MTGHDAAIETLLKATSKARTLSDTVIAIKLGGSAMEDPEATKGTLDCIVAMQTLGLRLVLIHGGGKPIDRAMADAGLTPRKVAGRRYTDDATLKVVVKVLHQINESLVNSLRDRGANAVGFHGRIDEHPLFAKKLTLINPASSPPGPLSPEGRGGDNFDLGYVGQPTHVDDLRLMDLIGNRTIPVIPSLGVDSDQHWLNVNADTAASAVAGALGAEACYFLTDTPGILRDVKDPASRIPKLKRSECERLIAEGVIAGGMVPKVEACFEALDAGAKRAVILDGRKPHALLEEFIGTASTGTSIEKDKTTI